MPLWLLSIGMRKAFGTVDHPNLLQALGSSGVPKEYSVLLRVLYAHQRGEVHGGKEFDI